jgi:hypothetical protein
MNKIDTNAQLIKTQMDDILRGKISLALNKIIIDFNKENKDIVLEALEIGTLKYLCREIEGDKKDVKL